MKVLIVEDEPKTADYLERGLREQGYVVDVARDGLDGKHMALEYEHDVIVLDVMLPGTGRLYRLARVARASPDARDHADGARSRR